MKILNGAWKISMLVVLAAGISLTSCTKKAKLIGLEIRPTGDIEVESSDTSTLIAYSVIQESMVTNNYTRILLGSMMDPVFGQTTANYYTQLRLQSGIVDFNFGQNAVIDSLILSLGYDGYYGDTLTPQTIRVFELNEKLNSDSGYYYYASDELSHYATEIGRKTFMPQPTTPVVLKEGDIDNPHIRINLMELSSEFGDKFLSTPLDILGDNEKFADYIYGLCIISEPVNEGGSIFYIDLLNLESDFTIYYHNDASDEIVYSLKLYDSITRFNQFEHNNYLDASPEFRAQTIDGDVSLGEEKLYVQAMAGVLTKIQFPFIKGLKDIGNLAINSAELTLTNVEVEDSSTIPDRLTLVEIDEDGITSQALIDLYEGEEYFGGYYDTINKEYKFQIARHIQQLVSDKKTDNGIYLKVYGSATSAGQLVLNGTNPSLPTPYSSRLKLKVTYTIIE